MTHRQPIFSIAYLLGGFKDFDRFPPHGVEIATLADTVFGREVMKVAVHTALGVLHEWGYNESMRGKIRTALSYLLLTNRSPNLGDLNLEFLEELNSKRQTTYGLTQLYAISRALAHLNIIPRPLPSGSTKVPLLERVDTDRIAVEWVHWCFALALPLGLLLLLAFALAVGVNLGRGRVLPCYCFGNRAQGGEMLSGRTLARLLLLFSGEAFLLVEVGVHHSRAAIYPLHAGSLFQFSLAFFWGSFVLLAGSWLLSLTELVNLFTVCIACSRSRAVTNSRSP